MARITLQLFIIGNSLISRRAIKNIKTICSMGKLRGRCELEVIDLLEDQERAEQENILATPLLIRKAPLPQRRIIGDLSNKKKVLTTLDLPSGVYE